jgi:peptidoglycan-N-acetylglucosamine deacetylase
MEGGIFGRPGFADKTAFMTWEQIKELSDRGHEIVNHSWHHSMKFQTGADDYIMEEIHGIEKRCVQYGIPKPTCFGAVLPVILKKSCIRKAISGAEVI